jgi:hypothetical protein
MAKLLIRRNYRERTASVFDEGQRAAYTVIPKGHLLGRQLHIANTHGELAAIVYVRGNAYDFCINGQKSCRLSRTGSVRAPTYSLAGAAYSIRALNRPECRGQLPARRPCPSWAECKQSLQYLKCPHRDIWSKEIEVMGEGAAGLTCFRKLYAQDDSMELETRGIDALWATCLAAAYAAEVDKRKKAEIMDISPV